VKQTQSRWIRESLPVILQKVVDGLLVEDWFRLVDEAAGLAYFVIGRDAFISDLGGEANFNLTEWPPSGSWLSSSFADWYVRALAAEKQPDFFNRAKSRLEAAGISPSEVERIIRGEQDLDSLGFHDSIPPDERIKILGDFLDALRIIRYQQGSQDLDVVDEKMVELARLKKYLNENCKKYTEIVERSRELDPLTFHDPQIEEASRCFLYGFNRAAIVLSASTLETHLKRATSKETFERYQDLVDTALWTGKLTKELAESAKFVFHKRNAVVHADAKPNHDDAQGVLVAARDVINHLQSRAGAERSSAAHRQD
jgi:hypothetical protein